MTASATGSWHSICHPESPEHRRARRILGDTTLQIPEEPAVESKEQYQKKVEEKLDEPGRQISSLAANE